MSNDLTISNPEGAMAPLIAADHIRNTIDILSSALTYDDPQRPTIDTLPTPNQRGRLNERQHQIRSLLRAASDSMAAQAQIGKAVGNMLGGWLNLRVTDSAEVIAGFTAKLQELPGWAVTLACKDFEEGTATFEEAGKERRLSTEYAPSAATVYVIARRKLDALYAEEALIEKIMTARLAAPVLADDQRAKVGEMVKGLAKQLGASVSENRERETEAATRAARESEERRIKFAQDADDRRMRRYADLNLWPVKDAAGRLCDPDALPNKYRFDADKPAPIGLPGISRARV